MKQLIPGIRNGVRAVIFKDDHLLLLHKEYEDGSERYVLPGGSQDMGETLAVALQRECREEIGTEVAVSGLLFLADFFKPRTTTPPTCRQQVEYFFLCHVPEGYVPKNGHHPDKHQVSVDWIARRQLDRVNLFPSTLSSLFMQNGLAAHPVYLGSIEP
jgi:8-oxo-dGTP pyrophosphatase MutT (NUDIX family)